MQQALVLGLKGGRKGMGWNRHPGRGNGADVSSWFVSGRGKYKSLSDSEREVSVDTPDPPLEIAPREPQPPQLPSRPPGDISL